MSQEPDVFSACREAVTGLIGGSTAWLLTCSLAGIVATATVESNRGYPTQFEWMWGLAWIGHLAVAGIAFWGLLIMCIHAWCISELVHGTERPLRVIVIAFLVQLTTSSIVTVAIEHDVLTRIAVMWGACATVALNYLIGSFVKEKRQKSA